MSYKNAEEWADIFSKLGAKISDEINIADKSEDSRLNAVSLSARHMNAWFTRDNIFMALSEWSKALEVEKVRSWLGKYELVIAGEPKNTGVINAGNIPFVGMHDLLCVLASGNNYTGKNATGDTVLLPYIVSLLIEIDTRLAGRIRFEERLQNIDAVIATGNNNSARYFEYYFGKYPHIIRKNRNGIALLDGTQSDVQLKDLGKDIFSYFGLGCRNISKVYVPKGYKFDRLFESVYDFKNIMNDNKYMNNFDFNNSVLLLKQIPFLQNGFLIIREDKSIPSPIAVLHYEEYENFVEVQNHLINNIEKIQCIVSDKELRPELNKIKIDFGKTQSPALWDYADGVNTLSFLLNLPEIKSTIN